jgi:hypothetical protein
MKSKMKSVMQHFVTHRGSYGLLAGITIGAKLTQISYEWEKFADEYVKPEMNK